MKGFDPRTSFGHEVSKRYDGDGRGDEAETVAFLARLAGQADALEFAVGTGRVALPLARRACAWTASSCRRTWWTGCAKSPAATPFEVTMGDMSRVTTGRRYGLVYLVYNTIGNLITQDDQVRCFENAARHLDRAACSSSSASSRSLRRGRPPVRRRRAHRDGIR